MESNSHRSLMVPFKFFFRNKDLFWADTSIGNIINKSNFHIIGTIKIKKKAADILKFEFKKI